MADKITGPVAIWQKMMGEMEKGFNAFASKALETPEISRVVKQVGGVSAGAQKQLGDLMENYLLTMNLPSRAQMAGMADRLRAIERQLAEIKTLLRQRQGTAAVAGRRPAAPRPPRAKRPPPAEGEPK